MSQYLVIIAGLIVFAALYYVGVYIRHYKDNRALAKAQRKEFGKEQLIDGVFGLFETWTITFFVFAVILNSSPETTAADNIKELIAAAFICVKGGFSYREAFFRVDAAREPDPRSPGP